MEFADDIIDILADNLKTLMDVKKAIEQAPDATVREIVYQIIKEVLRMTVFDSDIRNDDQYLIRKNDVKSKNTFEEFDPVRPIRDHFQGLQPKVGGKVKRKRAIRTKKKLQFKNGDSIFDDSISSFAEKEEPTNDSADSIEEVVERES